MTQRCRTGGPWRCRRLVSTWLVEARVDGVLVCVAAFTFEADARAVVDAINQQVVGDDPPDR